ncbi:hypothetical protein [Fictibacillus fluitans]|uniref:Uncharacterized protein n=1 Tax=Fictibacillus fluitans TaxID=3058422 RepID=A0ABT8HWM5_9BACL|nr:hypothetical protein [Fictibacillus sp. NE201]MDN4525128.1 hypothetical protein [Fictibacillus sp. NE201]
MAIIRNGSCVGVLYRASQGADCAGGFCVHNGRFIGGVVSRTGNTLNVRRNISNTNLGAFDGIIISHWAINPTSGQATLQHLWFRRARLADVRLIPNAGPCPSTPPSNNPRIITPGECVGIKYRQGNVWMIRNGRYLFWTGQTRHCILDERSSSTNLQFLRSITYSDYTINPATLQLSPRPFVTRGLPNQRINFVFKTTVPSNGQTVRVQNGATRNVIGNLTIRYV